MLVLSRKRDEEIIVGGNIVIRVIDIRGDKVRIGVSAPSEITIDRSEIAARKELEGRRDR